MSKVVLLSRTRTSPKSGTGLNSTSDSQMVVNDTVLFMSRRAEEDQAMVEFQLDEFCVPNTFAEVTGDLILDEQGVGIVTVPLSGYFTYSAFATYLQTQLNTFGTLAYTVTFDPYPFASYTISAPANFRFNLSRPVPDNYFLSDVSVYLGLTPSDYPASTTPYALTISSTKAAILNVNTHMLLAIQPIQSTSVMSSGLNFAYIVPVDANKTEYIRFRPNNQFKQKIEFLSCGTENYASWRVQVYRIDGSFFTDLSDWTVTLGYAVRRPKD